jgi:hypothetical protein
VARRWRNHLLKLLPPQIDRQPLAVLGVEREQHEVAWIAATAN